MSKIINLNDYKKDLSIDKNVGTKKETLERLELEINTECDDFTAFWKE